MERLYDRLREYGKADYYGFHMPGHKRNEESFGIALPYGIDITEIEGFDDLHHSRGILKEAQENAARVYGAEESCFLINGSTVGILSAILGNTRRGDEVLAARNCHKSVYNAIFLNGLNPVYLYPSFDRKYGLNRGCSAKEAEEALRRNPKVRAVILASPTYDGAISEIEAIAQCAHKRGIPLIVDEAHGAHFGFHSYFSENANRLGADIVIHSLHKTLPSLTQTALLHMNGELADRMATKNYLSMLQSSSPSYVLMAGIDRCIQLLEEEGGRLFDEYAQRLEKLRSCLGGLKRLSLVERANFDKSKLIISVRGTNLTSAELYRRLLEEYHLQLEMTADSYVLAMTSIGDTDEGFKRLCRALYEIDESAEDAEGEDGGGTYPEKGFPAGEKVCTSAEVFDLLGNSSREGRAVSLPWEKSAGYVSLEYAYLYPPGSPLIVPGERILKRTVEEFLCLKGLGIEIKGLKRNGRIEVWTDG